MLRRVLIINPNGSSAVTQLIKSGIDRHLDPETLSTYWTCPGGPPVLQCHDIDQNADTCFQLLLDTTEDYDGFLLACYADHPLVTLLRVRVDPKPIVGIFEASIYAALSGLQPAKRFAILTTGEAYEKQLQEGVVRLLGKSRADSCFAGVVSTGVDILDFAKNSQGIVEAKIKAGVKKLLGKSEIAAICIGGVILFGMESLVREACLEELESEAGREIIVIDQLEAGAVMVRYAVHKK
ncbi:uncharacterized protein Z519_07189 [Cladophialophora bantiana CBS 173.52]|uniref:Asp/Glu/hydantoin racemase n=1 Tax=Cladophialophora bantiana (strain ATCC 10958 / CBS 173.52 / CDC B-1940 / NIH 8579) TaxID=1442370 RepID=A0A0D2HN12_CLAB1|nr:uncharacterized protein Z519_07189 [Cladophialophora bantiana CBS 173.52]KIW92205.1 hypothetical protein Z519_07189 [Cladophialophora bantiana CBS 173.52]